MAKTFHEYEQKKNTQIKKITRFDQQMLKKSLHLKTHYKQS